MPISKQKFFISTAIDYVNSAPHLGHALEKIQADVVARHHRVLGEEVFFLSGTDENSLKNVQAARKEKIPVKKLVDRNAEKFYELKKSLNLSFDDFIRTTEKRHIKGAQKLWKMCKKDIYKKKYKGLYCVGCEEFYKESELENGLCPEHKKKPEMVEEENYFFSLSKYQDQLKKIIETDQIKIIPKTRKNETISFIGQGLEDICISRLSSRASGWGIDVPEDTTQKIWVWLDALSNYINALGYGENEEKFQEWWQKNENKIHIIGKGILRFHAIYWPAFLLSAGIELPKTIFVHGYITSAGQKMSKSIGNVVDPFKLAEKYGTDAVRYFLLREIPASEDGDFTYEKFEERYNADLSKGLGNLVARVLAMAEKLNFTTYNLPRSRASSLQGRQLTTQNFYPERSRRAKFRKEIDNTLEKYKKALGEFKFNEALISIWELIGFCDRYIEEKRPWETKSQEVIGSLLFVINDIAGMLQPFLPETSEKILEQTKKVEKGKALFPKI